MKKTAFWKADWFLGLVIAVVLLVASGSDLVQSLERQAYDLGVRASSHARRSALRSSPSTIRASPTSGDGLGRVRSTRR
jgi:hypothetical protein